MNHMSNNIAISHEPYSQIILQLVMNHMSNNIAISHEPYSQIILQLVMNHTVKFALLPIKLKS